MDDSTRSPRSALRLSSEHGPRTVRSAWVRIRTLRLRCALFLLGAAPASAAIPVGPFCGDTGVSALEQNGSLTADGIASVCGTSKTCPGSSGPNVPYVANTFTNDTGADVCLTVDGSSTCTGNSRMTLVAYLGSFDPSNVCTNYLADSGDQLGSGTPVEFSTVVPAGQSFVIVAADASPGNDCGQFCFTMSAVACSITCPDNITVGTGPGSTQCGANVPFDVTLNCGGTPSCTANGIPVSSGDFFPVGTTTVTCSGAQSQCSFDITVNDTTPPAVTCPAPTSAPADGNCQGTVPNVLGGVAVSDNCVTGGSILLFQSPTAGTIVGVGVTTITVTADDGTNQSQCTTTFTVNDTVAPQITCPSNIDVTPGNGECSATVRYTVPTATDTCSPASVVCLPASGSSFPAGTTTVTCTATDASNNQSQCTFDITVHSTDTTPPTITCPADVITFAAPDGAGRKVDYPDPDVGDNCSGATAHCVPASGSTFPLGDTQVTCTATDASQNTSQCTFTVSVRPNPIVPTLDARALAALAAALAGIGLLFARRR